ncbi:hypothetical protein A5784_34870 [Mycobacterium sp. 852013-50091_SCH5140682]|uniref:DUF3263 domain-containing protein n=1 Tax=Mycobacterium sp. 852013-50091_SCH5140682 TaxID=1834109 RepID=UPI0007E949B4|nr:DUF3263 domain-containing protein [Mycobacterium sp. 852013-50091_SCH5140682]OBC11384.1 hypothetical protein A5784_34870 [Mycobacterium sp. 852013-50091_SCH5140682]
MDSLTDRDRAMLDLECQWFATVGGKEDAIRALGFSPVRYYQRLATLITHRPALEYDSVTVNRLRRVSTRSRGES